MRVSLGNKGANLAEMSNLGVNVPPGIHTLSQHYPRAPFYTQSKIFWLRRHLHVYIYKNQNINVCVYTAYVT